MSIPDQSDPLTGLRPRICHEAVDARDPRFDGVFFVAITSTGIYCRPVCPSRSADPDNRRFFQSAAAAEREGFRPCLRCRPELAPGRALMDAVPRLASAAADRIAAGALNTQPVGGLASELHVSERHLRRALKREMGVSPIELAQTHRLLLAKRLLADTSLDMSRIAYASGFQSLRRFNAVVRERYGMPPTELRRASRSRRADATGTEPIRLSLAYRPPFAWVAVLEHLDRWATPGIEHVDGQRYSRTVRVQDRSGVVTMEDAPESGEVTVEVSSSLVPVLMPLLTALRRFLDLDAEPAVIDARLSEHGLRAHVAQCPGLRLLGAIDGFEFAFLTLVRATAPLATGADLAARLVERLGDPLEVESTALNRIFPDAARVAEAGVAELVRLGLAPATAGTVVTLAGAVAEDSLRLVPGSDPREVYDALVEVVGLRSTLATRIVMRALSWPDAFPAADPDRHEVTLASEAGTLLERAEAWSPWRSYAALHLERSPDLPVA